MAIRLLAAIGFASGCLLVAADEPQQKAETTHTQRVDFPAGGTLRIAKSTGTLTVEAWDRPDVEITTIHKNSARVTRHGDELVVTMDFPRHLPFSSADPDTYIKAPSTARIIASHDAGNVTIDGLAGDIQVTLGQGEILLHLPQDGRYDIHAKSQFGDVNSDFPGPEKRRWWLLGHRSVSEDSQAAHKLNLRVGYGDIVILKTRVPAPAGAL